MSARPERRVLSPRRVLRHAVPLAAVPASAAVLLAACGGSPSPASRSARLQQAVAYAQCIRTKGDPAFPDPDSQGAFIHDQADAAAFSGPIAAAAMKDCRKLRPPAEITAAMRQQIAQRELKLSACMRSYGFPSFPDPEPGGSGFNDGDIQAQGIDVNSPQYQSAIDTCQRLTGLAPP